MRGFSEVWATWVRRAVGARAICATALAVLALGGCASGRGGSDTPSDAVDLNTGRRSREEGKTTVRVDNQNLSEMTIYAYQGTQRMRLGRAKSSGLTELRIPSSMVSGVVQMRFYAQPMVTSGARAYLSESIPVEPGDQVEFLIPYTR